MTATAPHTYCERHVDGDPICVLQERGVRQVFFHEDPPQRPRIIDLLVGIGFILGAAFAAFGFWAFLVVLLSTAFPEVPR